MKNFSIGRKCDRKLKHDEVSQYMSKYWKAGSGRKMVRKFKKWGEEDIHSNISDADKTDESKKDIGIMEYRALLLELNCPKVTRGLARKGTAIFEAWFKSLSSEEQNRLVEAEEREKQKHRKRNSKVVGIESVCGLREVYAYTKKLALNAVNNARNSAISSDIDKMLRVKIGESKIDSIGRIIQQVNAGQESQDVWLYGGEENSIWHNCKHSDNEIRDYMVSHYGYLPCKEAEENDPDEINGTETRREWVLAPLVDGESLEETRERIYNDICKAINALENGIERTKNYEPRKSQIRAIEMMDDYFSVESDDIRYFLLAAKPRFGKNHALLRLFEKRNWKRVLVLSYLPFVFGSMKDDINEHIAFTEWQYLDFKENRDIIEKCTEAAKTVVSSSAQLAEHKYNEDCDYSEEEAMKFVTNLMKNIPLLKRCCFDAVVIDEAHYGGATRLFQMVLNELGITNLIYVSGTAMQYVNDPRFNTDNTFTYDYIDECNDPDVNDMPRIKFVTYEMNESVVKWVKEWYNSEGYFTFRKLWAVDKDGNFVNRKWVEDFLAVVLGKYGENPRVLANSPYYSYPIWDSLWVMPHNVKAIKALERLINELYGDEYYIINGAGSKATKTSDDIKKEISKANTLRKKTITLTCIRFLTGVSVPEWNAVFMMDDSTSIVRYIQAVYRAQTPDARRLKKECYVLDFCPQRTLAIIHEYAHSIADGKKYTDYKGVIKKLFECSPLIRHGENWVKTENEVTLFEIFDAAKVCFKSYDRYAGSESLTEKWDSEEMSNLPQFTGTKSNGVSKDVVKVTDSNIVGGKNYETVNDECCGQTEAYSDTKKDREIAKKNCQEMLKRIPEYLYLTYAKEETVDDVFNNLDEEMFVAVTKNEPKLFRWAWDNGFLNKRSIEAMIIRFNAEETELEQLKEELGIIEWQEHRDKFIESWFYRPDSTEIWTPHEISDLMVESLM